ncbi:MAG: hypothetical protein NT164_07365 [Verrucomicrobiae bacterium]|nr:hypothetical protein [Verrucomicrobiae bacterium]
MAASISSRSLKINEFQEFSESTTVRHGAIVGEKKIGSGLKAVSFLSFQRAFGGTYEIVNDFQKALSEKYGEEIANFVFSSDTQKEALSKGLNKETITAVLKKAEAVNNSPFKDDFFYFVFSSDTQEEALSKGLNKETITAVLKKAEAVNNSPFKDDFFLKALSEKRRKQLITPPSKMTFFPIERQLRINKQPSKNSQKSLSSSIKTPIVRLKRLGKIALKSLPYGALIDRRKLTYL